MSSQLVVRGGNESERLAIIIGKLRPLINQANAAPLKLTLLVDQLQKIQIGREMVPVRKL